ncbi:MAG: GAF domain-containing protein [Chloroflexi bacterium]|nr:GAF domain-containing protein [Chloroflexota bacterium]
MGTRMTALHERGMLPSDSPSDGESHPADDERSIYRPDLDSFLDRLLAATGADAAELFLTAPCGRSLVPAAQRERVGQAFSARPWLDEDGGLPGLVARTGEPVFSFDLAPHERMHRTSVRRAGFHSGVCVPVCGDSGSLGSLQVVFSQGGASIARCLPRLLSEARNLGQSIEIARLRAAQLATLSTVAPDVDAATNLRNLAAQFIRLLVEVANLDGGALLLVDEPSRALEVVGEWRIPLDAHRSPARAYPGSQCPAMAQGQCLVHTDAVPGGSSVGSRRSGVGSRESAVGGRQSGVRSRQSEVRSRQSAVGGPTVARRVAHRSAGRFSARCRAPCASRSRSAGNRLAPPCWRARAGSRCQHAT